MAVQPAPKDLDSAFREKVQALLDNAGNCRTKKERLLVLLAANLPLLESTVERIVDSLPGPVLAMAKNFLHFDLERDLVRVPFGLVANASPEDIANICAHVRAALEDLSKYADEN
jgi:hypothetical protein